MTYILFNILILFLWNTGLQVLLQENMLLHFIKQWYFNHYSTWYNKVLWWILKPTILCASCCCSVHGIGVTLLTAHYFNLEWSVCSWMIVSVCTLPLCFFLTPKLIEEC